jgi:hypothetical protein
MTREDLHPVQRQTGSRLRALTGFDKLGELGISAIARTEQNTLIFTTGADLLSVDTGTGACTAMPVPGLIDVHELSLYGQHLWIANTGADEAVEFDLAGHRLLRRVPLDGFRETVSAASNEVRRMDRFHCNQVFSGLDGDRYALVHHVNGIQLLRKLAERLIKSHGNGGVLNLDRGTTVPLGLKAPHSVRVVEDRYFVCDSGANRLCVYDRSWRLLTSVPTRGFGRGAAWDPTEQRYYVGISSTRARYLGIHAGPADCRVQTFSTRDYTLAGEMTVPDAEQISNLYLFPETLLSGTEKS